MKILLKCVTYDGWPVFITGNHPSLGNWDTNGALPMQLETDSQGRREWSSHLELAPGQTVEYKFIKKADDAVHWEAGGNRVYTAVLGPSSISDTFRT